MLSILPEALSPWCSRLQRHVTTATAEAEYVAVGEGMQEVIYLRQLQEELLDAPLPHATTVHTDNQPAIAVGNMATSKMRHIRLRYHLTRECIADNIATLKYISTKDNPADLFTKLLDKQTMIHHISTLLNVESSQQVTQASSTEQSTRLPLTTRDNSSARQEKLL